MVDEIRVTRLLRSVDASVGALERRRAADATARSDETWLMAVKYAFITAIEGCIDIAQHICSVDHLGVPATNADAMRHLGRAAVIDSTLADAMASAVGFRNVLVHEYIDVDDGVVVARLDDLSNLHEFVASISTYIATDGV